MKSPTFNHIDPGSRLYADERRAICRAVVNAGGTAEEAIEAIVERLGIRVTVQSVTGQMQRLGLTFAVPPARAWLRNRLELGPISVETAQIEIERATGRSISHVILRSWAHQDKMRFARKWSETIMDRVRELLSAGRGEQDTRAMILAEFGCAPDPAAIRRQMRPSERKARTTKPKSSELKRISELLADRKIEPWEAGELLVAAGYSNVAADIAIMAYWASNVNLADSLKRHAQCEAQAAAKQARRREDLELREAREMAAEMGDEVSMDEDWMRVAA